MRLDEAGGDAQVRLHEAAVELDRRSPRPGAAEIEVGLLVARVVILDAHVLQNPGVAHELGELVAEIGPVQTRRDEHRDAIPRHARRNNGFDHRAQEQAIGDRPRDVADEDAGARPVPGELRKRPRADGLGEGSRNRRPRIGKLRQRTLANDGRPRRGGQRQRQMAASIGQCDFVCAHRGFSPVYAFFVTAKVKAGNSGFRRGRACPGHLRGSAQRMSVLSLYKRQSPLSWVGVDGRDKPGHDRLCTCRALLRPHAWQLPFFARFAAARRSRARSAASLFKKRAGVKTGSANVSLDAAGVIADIGAEPRHAIRRRTADEPVPQFDLAPARLHLPANGAFRAPTPSPGRPATHGFLLRWAWEPSNGRGGGRRRRRPEPAPR